LLTDQGLREGNRNLLERPDLERNVSESRGREVEARRAVRATKRRRSPQRVKKTGEATRLKTPLLGTKAGKGVGSIGGGGEPRKAKEVESRAVLVLKEDRSTQGQTQRGIGEDTTKRPRGRVDPAWAGTVRLGKKGLTLKAFRKERQLLDGTNSSQLHAKS